MADWTGVDEAYSQRNVGIYYGFDKFDFRQEFVRRGRVYPKEISQNPKILTNLILMEDIHEMWEKYNIRRALGVSFTKFLLDLGMVRLPEHAFSESEGAGITRLEARVLRLVVSYALEDILEEPTMPNKYFALSSSSFATH